MESEVIQLILVFLFIVLGFFIGKAKERSHYRRIRVREKGFLDKPAITSKLPQPGREVASTDLAIGSVVVSIDYYKRFLSGFRRLFGGELKSYSPLLDRGKREAILRMKESVQGADEYICCRLETSTISSGKGKAVGTVELIAYSTAITYATPSEAPTPAPGAGNGAIEPLSPTEQDG